MKNCPIRLATVNDLDAMERVENRCFSAVRRSSRHALRHSLHSPSQQVWIAGNPQEGSMSVAGVMTLHVRRHSLRIYSLAVMPAFRGSGLGARLVRRALREARRAGVRHVSLEAARTAVRLIRWYERFGFHTTRVLSGYYAPGRDAVRMRRFL